MWLTLDVGILDARRSCQASISVYASDIEQILKLLTLDWLVPETDVPAST
jgi:hypothetical protein